VAWVDASTVPTLVGNLLLAISKHKVHIRVKELKDQAMSIDSFVNASACDLHMDCWISSPSSEAEAPASLLVAYVDRERQAPLKLHCDAMPSLLGKAQSLWLVSCRERKRCNLRFKKPPQHRMSRVILRQAARAVWRDAHCSVRKSDERKELASALFGRGTFVNKIS